MRDRRELASRLSVESLERRGMLSATVGAQVEPPLDDVAPVAECVVPSAEFVGDGDDASPDSVSIATVMTETWTDWIVCYAYPPPLYTPSGTSDAVDPASVWWDADFDPTVARGNVEGDSYGFEGTDTVLDDSGFVTTYEEDSTYDGSAEGFESNLREPADRHLYPMFGTIAGPTPGSWYCRVWYFPSRNWIDPDGKPGEPPDASDSAIPRDLPDATDSEEPLVFRIDVDMGTGDGGTQDGRIDDAGATVADRPPTDLAAAGLWLNPSGAEVAAMTVPSGRRRSR